jgi:hypothetical protein
MWLRTASTELVGSTIVFGEVGVVCSKFVGWSSCFLGRSDDDDACTISTRPFWGGLGEVSCVRRSAVL